jgi:hypothetical protein
VQRFFLRKEGQEEGREGSAGGLCSSNHGYSAPLKAVALTSLYSYEMPISRLQKTFEHNVWHTAICSTKTFYPLNLCFWHLHLIISLGRAGRLTQCNTSMSHTLCAKWGESTLAFRASESSQPPATENPGTTTERYGLNLSPQSSCVET